MKTKILGSIILAGVLATSMFAIDNLPNNVDNQKESPKMKLSSCLDKADTKEDFLQCKNLMKNENGKEFKEKRNHHMENCMNDCKEKMNSENKFKIDDKNFGEVKSKMIENIKKHLECIEKSNTPEELKSCHPRHNMNKDHNMKINMNKGRDKIEVDYKVDKIDE